MTFTFHSQVFKWGDCKTVWVFLMCRDDDCYLFHSDLLDGRNTLCRKAFLVIPSCMKWTLWGIIHTRSYMRGGQERIKKKWKLGFFFNSFGTKIRLTCREIFFPPFGFTVSGFFTVIDEKRLVRPYVFSNIAILFTRNHFLSHAEREIGNMYAMI